VCVKSAPFEYHRPDHIGEVCAILEGDEDARIIAGGQSLVPMMAMRLVRPSRLVDIGRIAALAYVRKEDDVIAIGATTRQCILERDPIVGAHVPLLSKVLPWVGHAATRARGTIGGSLAHADPAAEAVLAAVTLGATLVYSTATACTEIPASKFFTGLMTTALPSGSCLAGVHFPRADSGQVGVGFHEINARRSDFAFASAAAQATLNEDGSCRSLALGIGAVTETPLRLVAVESEFVGKPIEEARLRTMIRDVLSDITPMNDLHASADYRRRAATTLAVRAVMDALASARGEECRVH
jgi:CO/xanthine dehydrogenase FAD-binding subunit